MVGIIIATHGSFAQGILQSAQMILGEQANVAACTLMPNESPDDIKGKMLKAIDSFENKEEILIFTDLWSGTPFNQANMLIEGHEKWVIIAGVNLPILVEAFSERYSSDSAFEIAKAILPGGREEIKVKPEHLDSKSTKSMGEKSRAVSSIPEGTVLGDGKIKYVLSRIDTRLLHGQVATGWSKSTSPNRIIVVSDSVANDDLRKSMIKEAAPPGVKAHVIPISKLVEIDKDPRFGDTRALLLFENPQDALRAIELGVSIKELNLGSIAHSIGKVVVTRSVAMDEKDLKTIEKLLELGIKFDVRKVPTDSDEGIEQIIKKAKSEMAKK